MRRPSSLQFILATAAIALAALFVIRANTVMSSAQPAAVAHGAGVVRLQGGEVHPAATASSLAHLDDAALHAKALEDDERPHRFLLHMRPDALDAEMIKRELGITNIDYMPDNTYLVTGTYDLPAQARRIPGVLWVDEMQPEWKRRSFAAGGTLATLGGGAENVRLTVSLVPAPREPWTPQQLADMRSRVASTLAGLGVPDGAVTVSSSHMLAVEISAARVRDAFDALAAVPEVDWVEVKLAMRPFVSRPGAPMGFGRVPV